MWMRAEKEGYREGEGVHPSVSKKEHERWLYFDGFNLRASIQENAVGSVALKGTLLNHQTKLQEYTQMILATTTTCFQAPSSYNFRQQHARTFGYHLWLLDLPHSAQRRSSRCGLDVLTAASEQTSLGTSLLPGFPAIAQTTSHCLPLRVDMERPDLLFEDTGNQVRTPYHQRQPSPSGSLVGQIRRTRA